MATAKSTESTAVSTESTASVSTSTADSSASTTTVSASTATVSVSFCNTTKSKRKRKVLTIEDKLTILKELQVTSATILAEKYGVGKSTISDIKRSKEAIMKFKDKATDMGMSKKAKVMKLGDNMKHDEAVYIWFKQKRMEGTPISGPILCEKAVQLYKKMHGEESVFSASTGWQWRFCKRHGIRNLS